MASCLNVLHCIHTVCRECWIAHSCSPGLYPTTPLFNGSAGLMLHERTPSADGYETNFAVNTLSAFALTAALEPALHASGGAAASGTAARAEETAAAGAEGTEAAAGGGGGARVVFVSSGGMVRCGLGMMAVKGAVCW